MSQSSAPQSKPTEPTKAEPSPQPSGLSAQQAEAVNKLRQTRHACKSKKAKQTLRDKIAAILNPAQ